MTDMHVTLNHALDAQASNDFQALALFNPSAEVDSLMERIAGLRAFGVPDSEIDLLLSQAGDVHRANADEREHERAVSEHIDHLVKHGLAKALTVKGFAEAARPLFRDMQRGGAAGLMAQRALRVLVVKHRTAALQPSLLGELGPDQHAFILTLVEATS